MGRNFSSSVRMQEKFRRLLQLVDTIAPMRALHTTGEIRELMIDRFGIPWSSRTVERDLLLLESMGLAERRKLNNRDFAWRLNIRGSESVQCAACVLVDHGEPVKAVLVKHNATTTGRVAYHPEAMAPAAAESFVRSMKAAGFQASSQVVRIRCAEAV